MDENESFEQSNEPESECSDVERASRLGFINLLKQSEQAGECPDLNLLAAFAEGNLTEWERDQIIPHLVRCKVCRRTIISTIEIIKMISDPEIKPVRKR
ncbi:MAG: zf-HC2 domain-containing protein [Blastocatellia bacterium]|nr:zf-HC2 domain-containing protein [Blastocatellia bacterium]